MAPETAPTPGASCVLPVVAEDFSDHRCIPERHGGTDSQHVTGAVCLLAGCGHIGNHEPATIVTVAEDQRQCLMGFHGCSQSRQLHIGYTIMLMEDQTYLDFVQPVADELQAGLPPMRACSA